MHYMFMLIQRFIRVHTSSSSNSAYLEADLCSILVATEATRSASGLLVTSSPLVLGLMASPTWGAVAATMEAFLEMVGRETIPGPLGLLLRLRMPMKPTMAAITTRTRMTVTPMKAALYLSLTRFLVSLVYHCSFTAPLPVLT